MNNKIKTLGDELKTQNVTFKTHKTNWNGLFNSKMCKLQTEFIGAKNIQHNGKTGITSIVIFYLHDLDKTIMTIEDTYNQGKPRIYNKEGNQTQVLYRIIKDNSSRQLHYIADLLIEYMQSLK
jgi:hypothetical protein